MEIRKHIWPTARLISLILLALIVLLPFFWMISTSLKPTIQEVFKRPPDLFPKNPHFQNYVTAWKAVPFGRYLFNSLYTSISVTILQVINAALCAYVFTVIKFKGRELIFIAFLVVMMIPSQVTVVPLYTLMARFGWLDKYHALIIPFAANVLGVFLLRQAFMQLPRSLVEAAIIDGCTHTTILRNIMLPLNIPSILTFAIIAFKWRWNDYFWVLIMTSTERVRTLPVGIISMRGTPEGGTNWHLVMAATMMVILPMLLIFLFLQKYFVEGVSRSGLKE